MYEGAIQDLVDELGRLPGVGPKSAQRIAFHILAADPADVRRLADALTEVKARVRFCEICGNVAQEPHDMSLAPGEAYANLVGANLELVDVPNREFRLRERITPIRDRFPYIIIDCPPALDLLTLNALIAADAVLVPIQCEFFALEGVSELMDTIDRVREAFQHPLKIEGILLTMYDERTTLSRPPTSPGARIWRILRRW